MHQEEVKDISYDMCKILKLTNGETIIGIVTKETSSFVEVTMVYKLAIVNNQYGRYHLAAHIWDTSINDNIPIRVFKTAIVAVAEPNETIMKSFSQMADDTPIEDASPETKEEFYELLLKNFNTDVLQ
jgi:hypothetical protein